MADFASALEEWVKTVQNMVELTPKEQAEITKAGAEEFKKRLESETRQRHYSSHKDPVYGHMADGLTLQTKNVDGIVDGKSTVGWENAFHATNARRLNDGTKKYKADHFVTNVQNSAETQEAVLLAEKAEYDRLMKKKGAS